MPAGAHRGARFRFDGSISVLWDFSTEQWLVTFSFACTLAFLCGWIADRIMGYAGFGVIGNWLLLLAGAYVGFFAFNMLGYEMRTDLGLTFAVCFAAGTVMLVSLAGFKAITHT